MGGKKVMKCDFWGCDGQVCEADEINGYFRKWDIPKVMDFWVRSYGGAERAVSDDTVGYGSR